MQTYTLTPAGSDKPVKVTAAIPSNWTADASGGDGPSFKVPGVEGGQIVSITAIEPNGGDDAARIGKAIRMQFEEGPNVKREDLSDGRVWVSEIDDRNAHARVFIPAGNAVVMGIVSFKKENESKLPEVRKVLETIKVVP